MQSQISFNTQLKIALSSNGKNIEMGELRGRGVRLRRKKRIHQWFISKRFSSIIVGIESVPTLSRITGWPLSFCILLKQKELTLY